VTVATEELVAPPPTEPGRLNKPIRGVVALVEVLLAGFAVWFAFDLWPRGIAHVFARYSNGEVIESTRFVGSWLAAAIGLGAVAALLVLDAIRQVVLAVRARPKRGR
jgi:hypothetical protein